MQLRGNTIFITGGTSGIGRAVAAAFHERGNQVIITGRREQRLEEMCRQYPGMRSFPLDVTDPAAIHDTARKAIAEFPALTGVVNNAGIQMRFDFAAGGPLDEPAVAEEIQTNLLGPILVAAAFLPHLRAQSGATLVNVSSGLAFVPMARFPVYCATKAAIHAWTLSLRHQLRHSGVKVVELIPPYVATELGGPGKAAQIPAGHNPPMPLESFIAETMMALESDADELAIGESQKLYAAASPDMVKKAFSGMNWQAG